MDCAGCAMNKDPSNLRAPINLRGSSNFEGLPEICGASAIWGTPSNLRGPSNFEGLPEICGSPTIWGPIATWWALSILEGPCSTVWRTSPIWGAPAIRGAQAIWGAPAIWKDLSNLKGPGNLRGPAIWGAPNKLRGPGNLKAGPLRTVVNSLKLSSDAVNEANHLRNCSTVTLCSELCQLHCLHVVEVVSDCCNMLTIIFKIEAHQKSSTKHQVRSKNGWPTSMTMLSTENERSRKLDTSNEVNILRMRKLVNTNFIFSE